MHVPHDNVNDPTMSFKVALGSAKIYQATIRMFKLPQLEQSCEVIY